MLIKGQEVQVPYKSLDRKKAPLAPLDPGLQIVRQEFQNAMPPEGNDRDLNPELLKEFAFKFALAMTRLVLRSEQGKPKSEKLLGLLRSVTLEGGIRGDQLVSDVVYAKETPAEDDYHGLPGIDGNSKYVALLKAEAIDISRRPNKAQRARALKRYARQFDEMAEGQEFPTTGLITVFRATDIMTLKGKGKNLVGLFKPPKQVREETDPSRQKIQTYHHAIQKFGAVDTEIQKKEYIDIACVAAEAQYEGVTNLGVVREARMNIRMSVPSQAFWYCYFWGTKNPPEAAKEMATRFNNIYAETLKLEKQDLLRGWTPQEGASGAHNVNGGFQTDIIFARVLLYQSIQDGDDGEVIQRENPAFNKLCDKAAFLWRGEPILFPDVMRDLVDLVRRVSTGVALPENSFEDTLEMIRDHMRTHYQHNAPLAKIVQGEWFEGSRSGQPSMKDVEELYKLSFERKLVQNRPKYVRRVQ